MYSFAKFVAAEFLEGEAGRQSRNVGHADSRATRHVVGTEGCHRKRNALQGFLALTRGNDDFFEPASVRGLLRLHRQARRKTHHGEQCDRRRGRTRQFCTVVH